MGVSSSSFPLFLPIRGKPLAQEQAALCPYNLERTHEATRLCCCCARAREHGLNAQTVNAPWSGADVGAPTFSGSSTTTSSTGFTIDAAGADIWNASDQFHFVYQPISGDVEVIARVSSLEAVDPWTNAGVMIRASLAANAAHAYSAATGANGVYFRRRLAVAGSTSSVAGPNVPAPVWVRVVRIGSLVTGYGSTNGTSWTTISSATLPLASTAYVGLAVTIITRVFARLRCCRT